MRNHCLSVFTMQTVYRLNIVLSTCTRTWRQRNCIAWGSTLCVESYKVCAYPENKAKLKSLLLFSQWPCLSKHISLPMQEHVKVLHANRRKVMRVGADENKATTSTLIALSVWSQMGIKLMIVKALLALGLSFFDTSLGPHLTRLYHLFRARRVLTHDH